MSTPFVTTPERRANLVKLARFLFTEPIEARQFNMSDYCSDDCYAHVIRRGCGTAGCAVGWGPAAGIRARCNESFVEYGDRVFIKDPLPDYWWCFAAPWASVDNTPKGAGKRILWLLLYGRPNDYEEQMEGEAPLCYADWTPTEADWLTAAGGVTP